MSRVFRRFVSGAVLGGCVLAASSPGIAASVSIDYSLVPLASPSQYEYRYKVTNDALSPSLSWFSIDFDPALYDEGSLLIASVGKAGWVELILLSAPAFPAQYDAYKATGAPLGVGESETGFAVRFTWLGTGVPGAQVFTVYDPATLNVLDTGVTAAVVVPPPPPPGVPEPGTLLLAMVALAGTAAGARRRAMAQRQLVHSGPA